MLCAAVVAPSMLCAATRTWVGGSGDWSVAENWQDQAKPTSGDVVKFPNTAAITVNVNIPGGVSVGQLQTTGGGSETIVFTGEKITLDGLQTVLFIQSPVEFQTPIEVRKNTIDTIYIQASKQLAFKAPMTVGNVPTLRFTNLSNTENGGPFVFYSSVSGGNILSANSKFDIQEGANFAVPRLIVSTGYSTANNAIRATGMGALCFVSGAQYTRIYSANAMPKAVIRPGYYLTSSEVTSASLYIRESQSFDRFDENDTGSGNNIAWDGTKKAFSIMQESNPIVLTLNGTASGNSPIRFTGATSVVWNPTNDFTQSFSNRAHTTTGTLTVKRGEMKMVGCTTFASVPTIEVSAGATFADESTEASSLAALKTLTLGDGATFRIAETAAATPITQLTAVTLGANAKLCLPATCALQATTLAADGSFPSAGTYTGADGVAGVTKVDWIEGPGTITVVNANTTSWKSAANGNWDDAENWTSGIPTADTKTAIAVRGADYFVDLSSATVWPKDVLIANPSATVRVREDVVFVCNGAGKTTTTRIQNGARFLVAGGVASFTNYVGTFIVEGSPAATSSVEVASGILSVRAGSNAGRLNLAPQGEVRVTGGTFRNLAFNDSNGNPRESLSFAGGRLVASGGTYVPAVADNNFNDGEACFDNDAQVVGTGSSVILMAPEGGVTSRVAFCGASVKGASGALRMGGTAGGTSIMDMGSTATHTSFGWNMRVGCDYGTAILNMSDGTLPVGYQGFEFGTGSTKVDGAVKGVLNMSNGKISYTEGNIYDWSTTGRPLGLLIGYGGYTTATSGRSYEGEVNLSGGELVNAYGHTLIGAGFAKGSWKQTGGSFKNSYAGALYGCGMIGAFGGEGALEMAGGTFDFASTMYVGGGRTNDLVKGASYAGSGLPANRHDAQGSLTFSGGTMTFRGKLVVGSNGKGVLTRVGSQGTLSVNDLQLACQKVDEGLLTESQTEAVLRFVLDAEGIGAITAARATLADGTEIEIDYSAYQGNKRRFKVIDTATLSADPSKLVVRFKDDSGRGLDRNARLIANGNGLYAAFAPQGIMMIVR